MIRLDRLYIAIGSVILGILCVDSYGIIIKFLGDYYSTIQLTVFRNSFAVLPLLALLYFTKSFSSTFSELNSRFLLICFIRGICFTLMHVCYFLAITNMNFATASTLTFSAPFFIAIFSIFLLNEKVGIYRWSAIIIGFIGVVMITRPASDLFTYYSLLPLLVAIFWSLAMIVLKFIPDNYSTAKIQFYSLLFSILGSIILYIFTSDHQTIADFKDLTLMATTGVLGGIAAILFIYAYRQVEASKLTSFEYIAIPSSFIMGWFFFKEAPLDQLFPGVIAIVLAGMIIIWRDSNREDNTK
tara:strand:- start:1682 stop:2578 length:897 start_codon:yes stop_codon:yes gene_type:complete